MVWRESRGPAMMSWILMSSATTAAPVKAPLRSRKEQVCQQSPQVHAWSHRGCCGASGFTAAGWCVPCPAGGEQVDEQTAQEETEDKLKQCIDNLMDKRYLFPGLRQTQMRLRWLPSVTTALSFPPWSAKARLAGLESLRQAFSSRVLYDFLSERRLTISDCLERSLKKGESDLPPSGGGAHTRRKHLSPFCRRREKRQNSLTQQWNVATFRQRGGAGGRRYRLRPAVYPAGGRRRGRGGLQDASTRSYLASHRQQRQHRSPPECEYRGRFSSSGFGSVASRLISFIGLRQCARALGMCCYASAAEDGEVSTADYHNTEVGAPDRSGNSPSHCNCPLRPRRTWSSRWLCWRASSCLHTQTERGLFPRPNLAAQACTAPPCRPGRCSSPSVLHQN